MSALSIVITVIQLLSAVALTAVILFQSGKEEGLSSAIGGGSNSFLSKNKSTTLDARLAAATKWVALVFVLMTLVLNLPIWG